jgi:hypothetical protein
MTLTPRQLAMKQARAIKYRKNKKQAVRTLCGHLRKMIREA